MTSACPVCKHYEYELSQLCPACGCDITLEAFAGVDKNSGVLRKRYALIYGRLQDLKRVPKAELKDNLGLQRCVTSPRDLEILELLPTPQEIEPIDIICLADSISRGRLELFFQLKFSRDRSLGQYAREEILDPFGHESLRDKFTLMDLYVPEMLRGQYP